MSSTRVTYQNYERSVPIPVPRKTFGEGNQVEYCLKQNFFDPSKASPPNSWTDRLCQRIADNQDIDDISFLMRRRK